VIFDSLVSTFNKSLEQTDGRTECTLTRGSLVYRPTLHVRDTDEYSLVYSVHGYSIHNV